MLLTQKQQKHLTRKFDKYECLTSKEILPTNQRQIKEQDEFKCSPLGKTFWKQKKTIEDQGKKQLERPIKMIRKIVKEKLDEIRELNDEVNHDYLTSYLKGSTAKENLMISMMALDFLKKYNLVKQNQKKQKNSRIYLN